MVPNIKKDRECAASAYPTLTRPTSASALWRDRSGAEWRVLDLLTPGVRGQQKAVAQELGITTQAVSKAVARAQWNEEHAARPAAARLLGLILEVR